MSATFVLILACLAAGVENKCMHKVFDHQSLVTFNAGLTPHINKYESRKTIVPKAIKQTHSDFICMQEIWFEDDMKAIMDAASGKYPYTYSSIHHSPNALRDPAASETTPCSQMDLGNLFTCLTTNCPTANREALMNCLDKHCAAEFIALPQPCLSCFFLAGVSNEYIMSKCANPLNPYNRVNAEGLLVLSRYPILSAQLVPFIPGIKQLFPRGYLNLKVKKLGMIVCTHLTSNIPGVPYFEKTLTITLGITSYEQQQSREIATLFKNIGNEDYTVMGDVNTGPKIPEREINGSFPNNYKVFLDKGYTDPFVTKVRKCTFCKDNPLVVDKSEGSLIIDHIFVKGRGNYRSKRILETFESQILSDHYGVQLDIWRPKSP